MRRALMAAQMHGRAGDTDRAIALLERARELYKAFDVDTGHQEIRLVASQYLIRYVLIDVMKRFAKEAPTIHVRVSTMSEQDVERVRADVYAVLNTTTALAAALDAAGAQRDRRRCSDK